MKKLLRWLLYLAAGLIIIYLLGPSPARPVYDTSMPAVPSDLQALEQYIDTKESVHRLRPDNEARIVWVNDSSKSITDYAIVYLHGFTASQEEGDPVHITIAKTFGYNLYLSRLAEHGLDTTEQMLRLTVDNYWRSAVEALAIGKQLGRKVLLMGTSTGGTQALQLAATFPDDVAGVILMSPNVAINNDKAWMLNNHWGLEIARLVQQSNYAAAADTRPIYRQYWTTPYRLEAAVQLQEMIETSMTDATFKKIKQPLLLLYYYKDAAHQDKVVKVDAMLHMFETVSTPVDLKKKIAIPEAGDHVIGSYIKSGDVEAVIHSTKDFLANVMRLKPVIDSIGQQP